MLGNEERRRCLCFAHLLFSHVLFIVDPIIRKIISLRLRRTDFEEIKLIARGFFGDVFLVRSKLDGSFYAMKVMPKQRMLRRHEMISFMEEKNLMILVDSEWITKLKCSFQDETYLYLIMEYLPGGDMMSYLCKKSTLDEDSARFYIAETIMAVNEIHKLNFVHRDIKPDNILIDIDGHIKLTDFGSCMRLNSDGVIRSNIAVGTPGYVSPEILRAVEGKTSYGRECDWWSVGIVLYEMVVGETPFDSENIALMNSRIMNGVKAMTFPRDINLSNEIKDLIGKLLNEKDRRLGKNGIEEIMDHEFFKGISWASLRKQTAPFIPKISGPMDTSNFEYMEEDEEEAEITIESGGSKAFTGESLSFAGFTYDGPLSIHHELSTSSPSDQSLGVEHIDDKLESTRELAEFVLVTERVKFLQTELDMWRHRFEEEEGKAQASESVKEKLMGDYRDTLISLDCYKNETLRLGNTIVDLEKSLSGLEAELQRLRPQYEQEEQDKVDIGEQRFTLKDQYYGALDQRLQISAASKESENVRELMLKTMAELDARLQAQLDNNRKQNEVLNDIQGEKATLMLELKEINHKFIAESRAKEDLEARLQILQNQFGELILGNSQLMESKSELEGTNRVLMTRFASLEKSLQDELVSHQTKDLQLYRLRKNAAMFELRMQDLARRYDLLMEEKQNLGAQSSDVNTLKNFSASCSVESQVRERSQQFTDQETSVHELMEDQFKLLHEEKASLECEISEIRRRLASELSEKSNALDMMHELRNRLEKEMIKRNEYSDAFAELKAANLALSDELKALGSEFEKETSHSRETVNKMAELERVHAMLQLEVMGTNDRCSNGISSRLPIEAYEKHESGRRFSEESNPRQMAKVIPENLSEQMAPSQTDMFVLNNTPSEVLELREKHKNLLEESERERSMHCAELVQLKENLYQEMQSHEIAEAQLKVVSLRLEKEVSDYSGIQTALLTLQKEKRHLEERFHKLEIDHSRGNMQIRDLLEENHTLKQKSEFQQAKIDAVVSKFEGTLANIGDGMNHPFSERSDWQDKRAQKMKAQELKWLRQKYDQEIERNKLLESQLLDSKLTKQQFEKELDDLKKTNSELRRQISQGKRTSLGKSDDLPDIKLNPRQSIPFSNENRLSSVIHKAKISLLSSIGSSNEFVQPVSQIEGWIKVPKARGIKFGWKRRYAGVINFKLYLVDDPKYLSNPDTLECACDLR